MSPALSREDSPLLEDGGRDAESGPDSRRSEAVLQAHSVHPSLRPSGTAASDSVAGGSSGDKNGAMGSGVCRAGGSGSSGGSDGVEGGGAGPGADGGSGIEPWVLHTLRAAGLIAAWYFFSMCLSLYNKVLIGEKHGHFPAPLLMTTVHFLLQYAIATFLLKHVCPASWTPATPLPWRDYCTRIVPTGVATALDIGLSNLSLVFITLMFYTMCKSSAPVFLLLFAFACRVEPVSLKLLGIIMVISVGVLCTVAGETQFQVFGFLLVMASTLASGLRWVLVQVLLQREMLGLTNPLVTLRHLAPVMALVCLIFSLAREPWQELRTSSYFDTWDHTAHSLVLMAFGGCLAFCLIMTEFLLVHETSAVTFSVVGTVKEGATILVSHWVFGDRFTRVNVVGMFLIMIGVSLFNAYELSKGHGSGPREVKAVLAQSQPMNEGSGSGSPMGDEWQRLLPGPVAPGSSDNIRSTPSASAI